MASKIESLSSAYETSITNNVSHIPFKNTNEKDILHSVLQVANNYISEENFFVPKIPKTWTHIQPTICTRDGDYFIENENIIKEIINDIINGLLKHPETRGMKTHKYYDQNNGIDVFNTDKIFISRSIGVCDIHTNYPPSSMGNGDYMHSMIDANEILTQIIEYATLEQHEEAIELDDIQCSHEVSMRTADNNLTVIEKDLNTHIEKKASSSGAWSQFKKMFFRFKCIRSTNK